MRNFHKDFGIEIVEIDVLDGFDPCRLQRGGAADNGQISAAEIAEGVERVLAPCRLCR